MNRGLVKAYMIFMIIVEVIGIIASAILCTLLGFWGFLAAILVIAIGGVSIWLGISPYLGILELYDTAELHEYEMDTLKKAVKRLEAEKKGDEPAPAQEPSVRYMTPVLCPKCGRKQTNENKICFCCGADLTGKTDENEEK